MLELQTHFQLQVYEKKKKISQIDLLNSIVI